jgi:hypothetical protein
VHSLDSRARRAARCGVPEGLGLGPHVTATAPRRAVARRTRAHRRAESRTGTTRACSSAKTRNGERTLLGCRLRRSWIGRCA